MRPKLNPQPPTAADVAQRLARNEYTAELVATGEWLPSPIHALHSIDAAFAAAIVCCILTCLRLVYCLWPWGWIEANNSGFVTAAGYRAVLQNILRSEVMEREMMNCDNDLCQMRTSCTTDVTASTTLASSFNASMNTSQHSFFNTGMNTSGHSRFNTGMNTSGHSLFNARMNTSQHSLFFRRLSSSSNKDDIGNSQHSMGNLAPRRRSEPDSRMQDHFELDQQTEPTPFSHDEQTEALLRPRPRRSVINIKFDEAIDFDPDIDFDDQDKSANANAAAADASIEVPSLISVKLDKSTSNYVSHLAPRRTSDPVPLRTEQYIESCCQASNCAVTPDDQDRVPTSDTLPKVPVVCEEANLHYQAMLEEYRQVLPETVQLPDYHCQGADDCSSNAGTHGWLPWPERDDDGHGSELYCSKSSAYSYAGTDDDGCLPWPEWRDGRDVPLVISVTFGPTSNEYVTNLAPRWAPESRPSVDEQRLNASCQEITSSPIRGPSTALDEVVYPQRYDPLRLSTDLADVWADPQDLTSTGHSEVASRRETSSKRRQTDIAEPDTHAKAAPGKNSVPSQSRWQGWLPWPKQQEKVAIGTQSSTYSCDDASNGWLPWPESRSDVDLGKQRDD